MTALAEAVLVLNKNYAAIEVANARRAICLMYKGIAEAVDVEHDGVNEKFYTYDFDSWREVSEFRAEFERDKYRWIKGVRYNIAVPSIVRLTDYSAFRKMEPKLTRRNLFARDKNTCQYCGKRAKTSELSIDHVTPKSRGGKLEWPNVVCACVKCNVKKANRTPKEAGMRLIRKPIVPKRAFVVSVPADRSMSWKHFIDAAYWNVELKD